VHTSGVPVRQVPVALQTSEPLQTFPSEQLVPVATATCVTPVWGLQPSVVHGLASSVATGLPTVHVPDWQVSSAVHALPSLHELPFAFTGLEQRPLEPLHEPTSWHWSDAMHTTGFAPVHAPP